MRADWRARLDVELEASQSYKPNSADWLDGRWADIKAAREADEPRRGKTGAPIEMLEEIGQKITAIPAGFHAHRTITRFLESRRKAIEAGEGIDWSTAEALAFCSLLLEGHPVRLSGQDTERGTFSQRHSVLIDQVNEDRYIPFNSLGERQARFEVINSMLSEEAVVGFEYGYSLAEPECPYALGGAVRRFRERRAGRLRPVRLLGRAQMAAHVRSGLPAAARLRRAGPRALLGAARAFSADERRGQHAGGELHHTGQLLSHPAPATQARHQEAAHPDDAEVAAAPQARGVAARRDGAGDDLPPPALGRCANVARREDQSRR